MYNTTMKEKMKKYEIQTRLRGTKQEYHVGRVINSNGEVIAVHTNKVRSQLEKVLKSKVK